MTQWQPDVHKPHSIWRVWFGPTGATPALDLSVDVLFFCPNMISPCLVQSCECVHNNFTSECRLNQKQCRFYPRFARFDSFGSSLAGSQKPAEPGAKQLVTFFIIKERSKLRAHYKGVVLKELPEMSNEVWLSGKTKRTQTAKVQYPQFSILLLEKQNQGFRMIFFHRQTNMSNLKWSDKTAREQKLN